LGPRGPCPGTDLGVVLGERDDLVDTADHAIDAAAIGESMFG
jgi:hypothetical protein